MTQPGLFARSGVELHSTPESHSGGKGDVGVLAPAALIGSRLRRHGWFAFGSGVLDGETIVVLDCGAAAEDLPENLRGAVRYASDEMRLMAGLDAWSVRVLHEFKRRGGRVRSIWPAGEV